MRALLFVAVLVSLAASGLAYNAHPAVLAYQGDVVMVGKVVDIAGEADAEFTTQSAGASHKGSSQKMTVEVGEVIKDSTGLVKPLAGKKTVVVWQEWPKTTKPDPARDTAPPASESDYLAKGGQYVLILQKIKDRDEYYLPNYHANRDSASSLDRYRVPADVEKWNWGKPAGGLQMAFFVRNDEKVITKIQPQPEAMVLFAVRNVSDKDVTIPLGPGSLHIIAEKGEAKVDPDLYAEVGKSRQVPVKQVAIKPGKIIFLSHLQQALVETSYVLPLERGEWALKVAFDAPAGAAATPPTSRPSATPKPKTASPKPSPASKPASQPAAAPVWSGRIESQAIKFTVK
jgi:cell division septation protein DedD